VPALPMLPSNVPLSWATFRIERAAEMRSEAPLLLMFPGEQRAADLLNFQCRWHGRWKIVPVLTMLPRKVPWLSRHLPDFEVFHETGGRSGSLIAPLLMMFPEKGPAAPPWRASLMAMAVVRSWP